MQKQDSYNEFFKLGQQKINFSFFELCLPDDDPAYTLKKVMEELDFRVCLPAIQIRGEAGITRSRMSFTQSLRSFLRAWKADNSDFYIEEFAEILKAQFEFNNCYILSS